MFTFKNNLKIVMTILARNEEDIIGKNIEHHISQGVTQFILTDNRSEDKTKKIAEQYKEVIEIIDEPGEDHNQSKWVTKMAHIACKLKPDWIIHVDADELWCGLSQLKNVTGNHFGSTKMFLHPPTESSFNYDSMRHYLDFEEIKEIPGECKVFHRPDPNIIITHGNHGYQNINEVEFTKSIWRHHYPIRSYNQLARKCIEGHEALLKRKSICERWKKWYDMYHNNELKNKYEKLCNSWKSMIKAPNKEDFINMIEFWSTNDVLEYFKKNKIMPNIGEWPKHGYKK